MQFNHDNMSGAWLAEELVNMLEADTWEIPELEDLLRRYRFRQPGLGPADGHQLREWATRLRPVFDAPDEGIRCAAANSLLDQGVRRVFLTTHDGMLPHMHFADAGDSVVERLRAMTAGGLAVFIAEAGGSRLGSCAGKECRRVFVDTSRGGRRAYCSARCGNSDAVQRYRDRQKALQRRTR
ncbi:CGNR zinc finger domain-containing protein [Arthrobacter mobilis]|uniref:CGNR zinc finger domain-containing protein n=1 Tax=Arthrobacter mobilis TaxID=2724944 RepID=A0A7X6K4Y7_9MICC|nr:CGNR zinc finger domain-containing protein [Arthrobacter mobilis]NKX53619.1 CGNR zinc finger domain-containing protein [Arthrobacter mobilis]